MTDVRPLILPRSIAIVGASPRNSAAVETTVRSGVRAFGVNPNRTEVAGQVVRVLVAGPASLVGRIPTGNDGRARTPLRATAPVPPDLAAVLGPTAG